MIFNEVLINRIEQESIAVKASKSKELINDLDKRTNLFEQQQKYNELLENSYYNRHHSQFLSGEYKDAGKTFSYYIDINNLDIKKFRYGYNFNHTLCPFWLNYQNRCNIGKLKSILNYYLDSEDKDDYFYFVTLTMPSLKILDLEIDTQVQDHTELIRFANNVINNLNKKLSAIYNVKGFIKKFECTYAEKKDGNYAHPHYHLLIGLDKNAGKRIMKDTHYEQALRTTIINYWYTSFLIKKFPGTKYNNALAAFDMREVDKSKIALEVAGYVSKGTKADYLLNQEIFDHAYQFFFNKRLITFVGKFKEINKLLNLDELDELNENEALDKVEMDNYEFTHVLHFNHYGKDGYRVFRISELEPDDTIDINVSSSLKQPKNIPKNDSFRAGLDNSNLTCKLKYKNC
ncbi:protein rep [Erysipelotrichaceae bacterium OttesenSCG-928-M19]|nr:protein rep [Erysipelotrichaceae bacterium OttesenSCG-928-M19]